MTEASPSLNVKAYDQLMNKEDSKFFVAEVKKFRGVDDAFIPVADRKDVIRREIYSAQSLLDNCRDGVTPEIIDRVIKQHRGGVHACFKEILKEKWSPLASLSINYLTAQKMIELKTSLINELNKKLKRKGLCEAEVERFQSDIADAKSKIKMSEAAAQELRERNERQTH